MKINKLLLPLFAAMTLALLFGCANPSSPDNSGGGGGGDTPPADGGGGGDKPPATIDYTPTLAKLAGTYVGTYIDTNFAANSTTETLTISTEGKVTYTMVYDYASTTQAGAKDSELTLDAFKFSYKKTNGYDNTHSILVNVDNTEYFLTGTNALLRKEESTSAMKDFIGTVSLVGVYPLKTGDLSYSVELKSSMGKRGFTGSNYRSVFAIHGFNSKITTYDSTSAEKSYRDEVEITDTLLKVKTANFNYVANKNDIDFAKIEAFTYVLSPEDVESTDSLENRIVVTGTKANIFAGISAKATPNYSNKNIIIEVGLVLLDGSSIEDFKKIVIERQIPGQAWTVVEEDVKTLLGSAFTASWTDTDVTLPNVYRYRTTATLTNDTSITSSAGADIIFCPDVPRITKTGNTSKSNLRGEYAFVTHTGFTMNVTVTRDEAGGATKTYTFDDTTKSIFVDIEGKEADINVSNNSNITLNYTLQFSYSFEVDGTVYSKKSANPPKFIYYK